MILSTSLTLGKSEVTKVSLEVVCRGRVSHTVEGELYEHVQLWFLVASDDGCLLHCLSWGVLGMRRSSSVGYVDFLGGGVSPGMGKEVVTDHGVRVVFCTLPCRAFKQTKICVFMFCIMMRVRNLGNGGVGYKDIT